MYSILTIFARLNLNVPVEVIFSVNALSIFSCVKWLVMVMILPDCTANSFLNTSVPATGVNPVYCAETLLLRNSKSPQAIVHSPRPTIQESREHRLREAALL